MEVLNIAKINDGLFIGDKFAGTNLSILVQFKISHIINTCGNQILYNLENAGIKYLTYNWPENPSNNIIFIKEEISTKILHFIDNSLQKGSGIMIFSLKGQNRACVAIIIYLMKKYNWSLKKCREYLSSKKKDVKITKNFINQLMNFEERLSKINNIRLINDWSITNIKNSDELLMNNTYLNEKENTKKNYLLKKIKKNNEDDKNNENEEINKLKRHIAWADYKSPDNIGKNLLIVKTDIKKDLYFQKKVNPITNHIKMNPIKSCIKYNYISKEFNTNKKIYILDKNNVNKHKDIVTKSEEKKEQKETNNKHILKNSLIINDNHKKKRKLTYDNKDNLKRNFINNSNKIIIDSEKKNENHDIININNNVKNENEKNNDIKIINNSIDKDNQNNELINLNNKEKNNLLIISQKQINNYINDNKYSLYFENSNKLQNEIKRETSSKKAKKDKKILSENKRYFLGQPNSKKNKENEKDNIIPKLNKNNTQQTLNYAYNLNYHKDKLYIKSLINSQEIKNNVTNLSRVNNSYNKKNKKKNIEIKNNKLFLSNDYNIINKNKNAYIFNQFDSYNIQPSGPIKLTNNIGYKFSNSADKKNNNFNSIIFNNNTNKKETLPKGIKKNHNYNRPLSAQRNNLKNNNKFNFNNSNGFSSNNMIEFRGPKNRMPSPITSQFSIMKSINILNNNNHNNRYFISNQENKLGISKKSYQKK